MEVNAARAASTPYLVRHRGIAVSAIAAKAVSGTNTTTACTMSGWVGNPKTVSNIVTPS